MINLVGLVIGTPCRPVVFVLGDHACQLLKSAGDVRRMTRLEAISLRQSSSGLDFALPVYSNFITSATLVARAAPPGG